MGTLFPARLEEWDSAKAQGAFFVEQHVVRTLIQSGKTPDRSDPVVQNKVARAVATDDDPTQINQSLSELTGDTHVGVDPLPSDEPKTRPGVMAFTRHGTPPPPDISQTPPPRPQSYPIMGAPGTLVSPGSSAPGIPVTPTGLAIVQSTPGTIDVTERVRVPGARHTSPTSFVRPAPRRRGLLIFAGLLVAAGGIAAVIVMGGSKDPVASADQPAADTNSGDQPAVVDMNKPEPVEQAEPVEKAAADKASAADTEAPGSGDKLAADNPVGEVADKPVAEPVADKPIADQPVVAEPVADKPVAGADKPIAKPVTKPVAVAKKPRPKVEKKPEPKETKWNADSPFMPVRTGK